MSKKNTIKKTNELKNPEILLKDILLLKKDLQEQNMNLPPGLAGMYGEILAYKKLRKNYSNLGFVVNFFSGQKGADIQLMKVNHKINIEVKTSRLKDEGYGLWYGVALNIKKCKKQEHTDKHLMHSKRGKIIGDFCYFDYIVFVTLDDTFSLPRFYVIPRHFIEKNEKLLRNLHPRFSSATHRLIISNNGEMPRVSNEQKRLIRNTEAFRNRWDIVRQFSDF